MSRVEIQLSVVGGSLVAGSVKLHVQEGGFARVPATHLKKTTICVPTLLTVLFICATGIMITIAPRSQAATPQSPTVPQLKTEPAPLLCLPFAGTIPPGFRAVRASPAERALRSPRSHPSGRSGARPRLLECPLGASPSVTRYLPFSVLQVISIPVWSDMLCGRFIFFAFKRQTSRERSTLTLLIPSSKSRGGGDATWPRGGRGQQTPRCVPNATRALPSASPRRSHARYPRRPTLARCSIFHF